MNSIEYTTFSKKISKLHQKVSFMNFIKQLTYILVSACIAFSCNSTIKNDSKPILSVSIEPQKFFLDTLVRDKYEIYTVIPSGSNPETFDPSPSQMVKVGKSKAYYQIGKLGLENTWLNNIKYNNPDMVIVDCSQGIDVLEDHHEQGDINGHSHPNGDPHIWSSTKTALIVAKNMYNSLILLDKGNQELYLDNFINLERRINRTDSIIKTYLANAPSKSFIIYHPALSYFSNEYGLNQLTIEVDGKAPTPKQLSQLIQRAKKENVKVIFVQAEFDQKNAEVIAEETGAKIVPFNPLSYNWDKEMINIAKALALKDE